MAGDNLIEDEDKMITLSSPIYILGGSPCCGKSTIAELIVKDFAMTAYHLDSNLQAYMLRGAKAKKPHCFKYFTRSTDEVWLRSPEEQNLDEISIYDEIFEYVLEDLLILPSDTAILAEGAGFMPHLVQKLGLDASHYLCMVPDAEFQYEKYIQRPWISDILKDCSKPKIAFDHWMKRDILFAYDMLSESMQYHYPSMLIDGTKDIEQVYETIKAIFRL